MITEYAHKNYPEVKIGAMPSASFAYPYTCNPDDVIEAMKFNWHNLYFFTDVLVNGEYPNYMNRFFLENDILIECNEEELSLIKNNTADFLSFSYYYSRVKSKEKADVNNPYLKKSPWGWSSDPKGLRYILNMF